MTVASVNWQNKLFPLTFLLLLIAVSILYVDPDNIFGLFFVVTLISLFISLISKIFFHHKIAIVVFFSSFILLCLHLLKLFNPINIALSLSFVIGLLVLFSFS